MPSAARDRQHLLGLEGLSASELIDWLDQAQVWLDVAAGKAPRLDVLAGRTVANLFFEDSTRTRCSFTLAARRLGADTLDLTSAGSSVSKGETIVDTALNLLAMGVDAFVVRSSASGGPHMIAHAVDVPVINAGDGKHEHPTQGLLDVLTLRQRLGDLRGRTVAIVGDVVSSRVARSAAHALTTLGANVIFSGPPTLVPQSLERITSAAAPGKIAVTHDFDGLLPSLDAIMMLRVQFERAGGGPPVISGDYRELYGLTTERARRLPAHAVVMHPGPINRGLEIDSELVDNPARSVILQQVTNGVAVRMAVLAKLITRS
jgi:aspartate carbamoyltransferase catalytic subunit